MSLATLEPEKTVSSAKRKLGRRKLLKQPVATTVSIEKALLDSIQKSAFRQNKSASQWWVESAKDKLRKESRRKAIR